MGEVLIHFVPPAARRRHAEGMTQTPSQNTNFAPIRRRTLALAAPAALSLLCVAGCAGGGSGAVSSAGQNAAAPATSASATAPDTTFATTTTSDAPTTAAGSPSTSTAPSTSAPAAAAPTTHAPIVSHPTTKAPPPPTTAARHTLATGNYSGTATVSLTSFDYCGGALAGERRNLGTQTFTRSGILTVAAPKSDGSVTESNPFDLVLSLGPAGGAGGFALQSAEVYQAGNTVLLQYWSLRGAPSSFSGSLAQTHESEGATANQFWAVNLLVPCQPQMGTLPAMPAPIDAGATLSGHVSGSHADLRLTGGTMDGLYSFTVTFSS